jgi:uncharacterized protein (TIGR03790 family)
MLLSACLCTAETIPGPGRDSNLSETSDPDPGLFSHVMVVYNTNYALDNDSNGVQDSLEIANYYMAARKIPPENICPINTSTSEEITRAQYDRTYDTSHLYANNTHIKQNLEECMTNRSLKDDIWYIALAKGVPLKISAYYSSSYGTADYSSVDLAVSLLFNNCSIVWRFENPYYGKDSDLNLDERFRRFRYNGTDMSANKFNLSYLVTRLDGYNVTQVLGMIDRAVHADMTRQGQWVLDDDPDCAGSTCDYMSTANYTLCINLGLCSYISYENTNNALTTPADVNNNAVIGYSSHGIYGSGLGSNFIENGVLTFGLRNGSIYTSWESFNGYSYANPDAITHNTVADWIRFGGTGGVGNTYEPWCSGIADEAMMFSRYAAGYTFAEAAYISLYYEDFTTTMGGDPITRIVPDNVTPEIMTSYMNWTRMNQGNWINVTVYEDYPDAKYIDYNGTPVYFTRTYKFNTSGWSYGEYNFTVYGSDTAGNSASGTYFFEINDTVGTVPNFSGFDGGTTQFQRTADRTNVGSAILEREGYGRIVFLENINVSGLDLNSLVNISRNYAYVNSSAAPGINRSANITIYNISYLYPAVYRDGIPCPPDICNIIEYLDGNLTFSVPGFYSYSAGVGAKLAVWDEGDSGMPYSGRTVRSGERFSIFANYTSVTSGSPVEGANCTVYIAGSWGEMPYNSSGFYEYAANLSSFGVYNYSVACNRTGFLALNTTGNITIMPAPLEQPPVITGPLNGSGVTYDSVNVTWESEGSSFSLQVDDDFNFMSPSVNVTGIAEKYYRPADHGISLQPARSYYVRVRSGTSGWGYLKRGLGESITAIGYHSALGQYYPSMAVGPGGIVHVAWYGGMESDPAYYNIRYANSTGWGNVFNITTSSSYNQYWPDIAVDSGGVAHISWYAQDGTGNNQIYYSNSTNWTNKIAVTTGPYDQLYPSIDVDGNGTVHIAWQGRCAESPGSYVIRYANSTGWANVVSLVEANNTYDQQRPSLAVGIDGVVHLAWYGRAPYMTTNHIRYANSTGWPGFRMLPVESMYSRFRPSLAVDRNGVVHIAYDGLSNSQPCLSDFFANIQYANSINFDNVSAVTCQSENDHMRPSLAADSAGYAHISWDGPLPGGGLDTVHYANTSDLSGSTRITSGMSYEKKYSKVGTNGNAVHMVWYSNNDIFYTSSLGSFLAVDTTPPSIYITSPAETSYSSSSTAFSASLNENASWCGLSLDGAKNLTINSASNTENTSYSFTNSSMTEGVHYAIFSCNDTSGNMKATSPRYFTVSFSQQPQPPGSSSGTTFYYPASSAENQSSLKGCGLEITSPHQITMALSKAGWVDIMARNYGSHAIYSIEFAASMPDGWEYQIDGIDMLDREKTGKSSLRFTPLSTGTFEIRVTAISPGCNASSLISVYVFSPGNEIPLSDTTTAGQMVYKAKQAITEGLKIGIDLREAEDLLNQAIGYLDKGQYTMASELASQAYEMAARSMKGRTAPPDLSTVISWVLENALAAGILILVIIACRRLALVRGKKWYEPE